MTDYYKGYRTPKSIIGYSVRLYYQYKLSLRDVSELLLECGIEATYETIRNWSKTWGPIYAQSIRKKRRSIFADKWHIDEMRVKIKGEIFWLWRLIDGEGEEIEVLLQKRRNAQSAIRFLKKALKRIGALPRVMVTDKLISYKKAHRVLLKSCEHQSHKRLNNRIENAHQPSWEKEKQMRGFKTPASAQKFISSLGAMLNLLKVGRYKNTSKVYREKLKKALTIFNDTVISHHHYA
ncbi:MAG: IS6 family transposase [Alphaproteobacteria bacterium]|nr:IS6 family transposase [Alphaproteobacteria bacterium]